MKHYDDKAFFKEMKKEVRDYSRDITESFPYFCLKIFWDNLSKDSIEEALHGLTTNDESIDAFFIDDLNKEIHIIQCKSCKSEKGKTVLKKEWLSYLHDVPSKLEDHSYIDEHKNDQIKEIAEEYAKYKHQNFKVKLHLFHLGNVASKSVIDHFKDTIIYYDWNRIKDEYQEYLSKLDRTEPPSIDIPLNYPIIQPLISNQHENLVSVITGNEIVKLRQQYRYKLFDKNLRFGLGKNKINKQIMETAKGEASNFYFYNNGITITSKGFKFKQTNNKLTIKYPQIINGAQTVNAIYEAFKDRRNQIARNNPSLDSDAEAKKEFQDISLLFRVIQDDEKDGKKTSRFEENVIRYNNSQNSIKETDFYANEPEQIKLQELFAKFGYFYEIKRGDRKYLDSGKETHNLLNKKKEDFEYWEEKIDIEKIASIWMAYQLDPTLDKVQKGNIFGYAHDKNYNAIFEEAEKINEYQVKEMILAWNLFDSISKQADIYGNTIKRGQIISKISQLDNSGSEKSINAFNNIQTIINGSFLFGKMVKKKFESQDDFFDNKNDLMEQIKKYQFFSTGKYLTLAIFNLILEECKYKEALIEKSELFRSKDFIDEYIVKKWLKSILDKLLIKEYEQFNKDFGSSLKTFYGRTSTYENIKKRFRNLIFDIDEPFDRIFPLELG